MSANLRFLELHLLLRRSTVAVDIDCLFEEANLVDLGRFAGV